MKAFLLFPIVLVACPPPIEPDPPPPPPVDPDNDPIETPEQIDMTPCEAACNRFDQLGCPEAQPTPNGETCVQLCDRMEQEGVVSLNPECIRHIQTCAQQASCQPGG